MSEAFDNIEWTKAIGFLNLPGDARILAIVKDIMEAMDDEDWGLAETLMKTLVSFLCKHRDQLLKLSPDPESGVNYNDSPSQMMKTLWLTMQVILEATGDKARAESIAYNESYSDMRAPLVFPEGKDGLDFNKLVLTFIMTLEDLRDRLPNAQVRADLDAALTTMAQDPRESSRQGIANMLARYLLSQIQLDEDDPLSLADIAGFVLDRANEMAREGQDDYQPPWLHQQEQEDPELQDIEINIISLEQLLLRIPGSVDGEIQLRMEAIRDAVMLDNGLEANVLANALTDALVNQANLSPNTTVDKIALVKYIMEIANNMAVAEAEDFFNDGAQPLDISDLIAEFGPNASPSTVSGSEAGYEGDLDDDSDTTASGSDSGYNGDNDGGGDSDDSDDTSSFDNGSSTAGEANTDPNNPSIEQLLAQLTAAHRMEMHQRLRAIADARRNNDGSQANVLANMLTNAIIEQYAAQVGTQGATIDQTALVEHIQVALVKHIMQLAKAMDADDDSDAASYTPDWARQQHEEQDDPELQDAMPHGPEHVLSRLTASQRAGLEPRFDEIRTALQQDDGRLANVLANRLTQDVIEMSDLPRGAPVNKVALLKLIMKIVNGDLPDAFTEVDSDLASDADTHSDGGPNGGDGPTGGAGAAGGPAGGETGGATGEGQTSAGNKQAQLKTLLAKEIGNIAAMLGKKDVAGAQNRAKLVSQAMGKIGGPKAALPPKAILEAALKKVPKPSAAPAPAETEDAMPAEGAELQPGMVRFVNWDVFCEVYEIDNDEIEELKKTAKKAIKDPGQAKGLCRKIIERRNQKGKTKVKIKNEKYLTKALVHAVQLRVDRKKLIKPMKLSDADQEA